MSIGEFKRRSHMSFWDNEGGASKDGSSLLMKYPLSFSANATVSSDQLSLQNGHFTGVAAGY
jgi:hypothetical protein